MNRRGSVILHVLVTGIIIAVIAAGLLRMTLMNYAVAARVAKGVQARADADTALHKALSFWSRENTVCADTIPGYSCAPASTVPPGACNCTCTPSASTLPTITTSAGASGCQVSIVTVEQP